MVLTLYEPAFKGGTFETGLFAMAVWHTALPLSLVNCAALSGDLALSAALTLGELALICVASDREFLTLAPG